MEQESAFTRLASGSALFRIAFAPHRPETFAVRWEIASGSRSAARELGAALGLSEVLAQCLLNRGWTDPPSCSEFLSPRLKMLSDPLELPNMRKAVDRLIAARVAREPLVIFGDYDVDGITSTAILASTLRRLGWTVHFYLPQRMVDGYGLTAEAVEKCLASFPARLLLAVDCGSTSCEVIGALQARGIDVIVLDHHQLADPPPPACALVNPLLDPSPRHHGLCSAALAFKLAHAIVKTGRNAGWREALDFDVRELLDLTALGVIADVVPLRGENRILAKTGLERLAQSRRPGIIALKEAAGGVETLDVRTVAYQLAPRLNAAGRLENAMQALDLLLAENLAVARPLAAALDLQNRQRQTIEKQIASEVIAALRASFNPARDYALVLGSDAWHIGVVGIVASRVVREFYRPAIVMGGDGECWRGSGRSIQGLDLADALRDCKDLLLRHGGHAMAAGVSMMPGNLAVFRDRLNRCVQERLRPEQMEPALRIDLEVSLAETTLQLVHEIERLQPIGQENPPAHLVVREARVHGEVQRFGSDRKHARFFVVDEGEPRETVWWNCGDLRLLSGRFDLAFVPQINIFREPHVQLQLLDVKPSS